MWGIGSILSGCDMLRWSVIWESLMFSSWGCFTVAMTWPYKPSRIWKLHVANKCAIVLGQNRTENKLIFKNLVWEYCSFVYACIQEYNMIKFMHVLICMRKWFTTVDQCVMNISLVCNIETSPCSLEIISVFHCNHLINCWLPANCYCMCPH